MCAYTLYVSNHGKHAVSTIMPGLTKISAGILICYFNDRNPVPDEDLFVSIFFFLILQRGRPNKC